MARLLPSYLDGVVSIEVQGSNDEKIPIATGFLFGKKTDEKDETGNDLYAIFLVTNRHVFQNPLSREYVNTVYLRFNEAAKGTKYYRVDLIDKDKKPIWIQHENEKVDLAVLSINGATLRNDGISFFFFAQDQHSYPMKEHAEIGIATGDRIFVLGFPMGLRGETRNAAIARNGIIARVDDEVLKNHYFYADVSAYPGNSGGPVIVEAEIMSVGGTKTVSKSNLIGVVSEGVTYSETAVSKQTGRPRIVFEEQTGLVKVVPIDLVVEVIETYMKRRKSAPAEKAVESPLPSIDENKG